MGLKTTFRLIGQAGPVARAVLDALGHRAELLLLDLAAARARLLSALAFLAVAAGFALLTGFALTLAYAAAVWHRPDRGLLLLAAAAAWLALASLCTFLAARGLHGWTPLGDTRAQLAQDRLCLQDLLTADQPPGPPEK
jgi:uncharacterized membrane protein YqjE